MSPPRRALIAVTSAKAPFYPADKETGVFITEAIHPYNIFKAAGFRVDFISETGNFYPDWLSLQEDWLKGEDKKVWEDRDSGFRAKLDDLLRPADVKASKYGIFFASAGHASLIDYPNAKGLQAIAAELYKEGGIVAAVCHGGAIFPGIKDASGKSIISGKKVTGFTTKGEEDLGHLEKIKEWDRPTIESSAASAGATYVAPSGPWDAFTVTDGRIVTGANPASAIVTAEAAVKAFENL
jgi:putative intracellular protease/amidase